MEKEIIVLLKRIAKALEHNNRFQAMQAEHIERLADTIEALYEMAKDN